MKNFIFESVALHLDAMLENTIICGDFNMVLDRDMDRHGSSINFKHTYGEISLKLCLQSVV